MKPLKKQFFSRILNQIYNISDLQRYTIFFITGLTPVIYSSIVFIYLKLYFLTVLSLLGVIFFSLFYKYSNKLHFNTIFYGILIFSCIFELVTAFFVEWAMGFQNFLFILIPLSFTFLYLENNYKEIIPLGIKYSFITTICYLCCAFIDYTANPFIETDYLIIRIINAGTSIIIITMLFSYMLMFISELYITHQKLLKKTNIDLECLRSSMMLSQIKPHFLYNTMGAIEEMIVSNPKRAQIEMANLSRYMRTNIDVLSTETLIPFKTELLHIKTYIQIQNFRFENSIMINYYIKCDNFNIPPLTLQPIVENSIKHGIRPKGNKGIINIFTFENLESYIIQIKDNGIGFDFEKRNRSINSTGLINIDFRLKKMCNGNITIESIPQEGTTITISIPKNIKGE